ncbi:MAG: hypothetical protein AAFO82_07950 [Bacteroidota bacterium]
MNSVQAWRFRLPAGRRLSVKATNARGLLFGNLYELPEDDLEGKAYKKAQQFSIWKKE